MSGDRKSKFLVSIKGGGSMETKNQLMLRVNGIVINEVKLRRKVIDGHLSEKYEVEVNDPILGKLSLTNDFLIEVKGGVSPKVWHTIILDNLVTLLFDNK